MNNIRWDWVALTAAIIMTGLWSLEDTYFKHVEKMQEISRQVVEK